MRQIPREAMEPLKAALLAALAQTRSLNGLRLVAPKVEEADLDHAACLALMALTKDWIKPEYIRFHVDDKLWV